MKPVSPTLLWTRPTVTSGVAPYQMSGVSVNGLNTSLLDRFICANASSRTRPFDSVAPSTTQTSVVVLVGITVPTIVAEHYSRGGSQVPDLCRRDAEHPFMR